ncbi:MAG: hydrogenase nickel incorporation protein HypB [Reinekea sp.]
MTMCETCGCGVTTDKNPLAVEVLHNLTAANDAEAAHNREHLSRQGTLCLNLMSSPGAGKTALLQQLIARLQPQFKVAVIEGDLETENDAERIRDAGALAYQINTGTACHLDAKQVHHAMHHLPLDAIDILFIENVGNLVCPASFDLGQHKNLVLLACTEGDDKPAKYPVMFRAADEVLISKVDLLPVLDDFDLQRACNYLKQLANPVTCLPISAKTGAGLDSLVETLNQWLADIRESKASA